MKTDKITRFTKDKSILDYEMTETEKNLEAEISDTL